MDELSRNGLGPCAILSILVLVLVLLVLVALISWLDTGVLAALTCY